MKLITALLLAIGISVAQAQEYSSPNKGGGEIRLTYNHCASKDRPFVSYYRAPDGRAGYGCWAMIGEYIHVRWNDGDNRIYDANLFNEVPGTRPTTKKGTSL